MISLLAILLVCVKAAQLSGRPPRGLDALVDAFNDNESNESSTSPESTGLKQPDPLLSLKAGGAESIPVLNPESESESELNSESEFESESESEPKSESECEQVGICECELNYTKSHHYTLRNHVKPQRN